LGHETEYQADQGATHGQYLGIAPGFQKVREVQWTLRKFIVFLYKYMHGETRQVAYFPGFP
jgi:hypothetical protein